MRVVYIDDEPYALDNFRYICSKVEKIEEFECFDNYIELLGYIQSHEVDLIFADISMPGIDGIELMEHIRRINEKVAVVYVTGHDEYALDAFDVGAFGYILKPCSVGKVEKIISRFFVTRSYSGSEKIIEIKTFGRFDIFINGHAVHFSNKKAKELFALMVDRLGGTVTMEQAIDVLWENRPYDERTKNLYRIALKNLRDTLKQAGCIEVLVESRGQRSVDFTKVKCDYYEYVNSAEKNTDDFSGEYMSDYSWGEYTLAKLCGMF